MPPITISSGWAMWLAVGACSIAATTGFAGIELTFRTETVLARPTIMAVEDEAVFSPDARPVAYPVGGREQRVCLDGVEGKAYDVVSNLTFSPDGKRLAYWGMTRTNVMVVVDGKEAKAPVFASYGEAPLFSPDSRHLAFGGGWGYSRGVVVMDDRIGQVYPALGELRFSPDSQHFAYMATRDDKTNVIVLDGKEIPVPDEVVESTFTFSPDGRRFAYGLGLPPKSRYVVDGQAGPVFTGVGDCYFSPDSRRLAYAARRGSESLVILDGKEVASGEGTLDGTVVFSPDSRRFTVGQGRGGKSWLKADDREFGPYDELGLAAVIFSPDSRTFAYAACRESKWMIIVDGKESIGWESAGGHVFSPDSQHSAYWAKRGGAWCVVLDGAAGKAYQRPAFALLFSADSRHLATLAQRADDDVVPLVDGVEGPTFEKIFKLAFDRPGQIRLLAQRRGTMGRKEWVSVELDIVNTSRSAVTD